ncbi:MAG TPA: flagellar biosynthetic protein FliO, partial [Labilithrix sp.]|nr:flagellar biosynthetic protein FliO [Labilithrix sp.]
AVVVAKAPVAAAAPPPAAAAAPPPPAVASAAPPPPAAPPAAPAPDASATPLAVRPAAPPKPLALAPTSEGLGLGYKLLAVLAIGGAVALYLRKKRGPKVAGVVPSKIDILARAGIGVRSQLVVVEVEGTRLLVGMTPSAIQTLAVLQTPEDDHVAAEARASEVEDRLERERDMIRPANLGDRVRSLLGADEPVMPRLAAVKPTPKPKARTSPRPAAARAKTEGPRESREVAGQARGLLLSADEDT